jgi:hypothetical protein
MLGPRESLTLMGAGLLCIGGSRGDKLVYGLQEGMRQLRDQYSRFSQPMPPPEPAERSLGQTVFAAVGWALVLIGILTCFVQ